MTSVALTPDVPDRAWHDPQLANVIYHNWEASKYDEKWSISYDERLIQYARDRFAHAAGADNWPYGRSLEIGCGTGFFTLNLHAAGVMDHAVVTDIAAGMVDVAARNARGLGLDIAGKVADAQRLPFSDNEFDLVIGHAVLHHIPDVEQAMREALRVLKPGGRFVFCGEPTRRGRDVAVQVSRVARWAQTNAISKLVGRRGAPASEPDKPTVSDLESVVAIHRFAPADLRRLARRSGAIDVVTSSDELTAAWFARLGRRNEQSTHALNSGYTSLAYRSWQTLSMIDEIVLGRVVPESLFVSVGVSGTKG